MAIFKLEHLEKYLTEKEETDVNMEDLPVGNPKDEDLEVDTPEEVGGFEMIPSTDEEAEGNPELEVMGYDIKKGDKDVCHIEIIDNSNEEVADFDVAQNEPNKYTIYVSKVNDKIYCGEYKNKLEGMGFENVVDRDEDKPEEATTEEE